MDLPSNPNQWQNQVPIFRLVRQRSRTGNRKPPLDQSDLLPFLFRKSETFSADAKRMTVYRYTKDSIILLANATFSSLKIGERDDLQHLLRDKIEVIAPDTLVIAEEFCDWDDSRRKHIRNCFSYQLAVGR